MSDADALARRIDALEMRLMHQEEVIEDLNKVVIEQWKHIDFLTQRLARLTDQLEAQRYGAGTDPRSEPPPPHY